MSTAQASEVHNFLQDDISQSERPSNGDEKKPHKMEISGAYTYQGL